MTQYHESTPCRPAFEESWAEFPPGRHRKLWAGREHIAEVLQEVQAHSDALAVDIEAVGLGADAYKIKVVGLATTAVAIALDPRDPVQAQGIRDIIGAARMIVFHNSPYDVPPLYYHGLVNDADIEKAWDTLILARIVDPDTFAADKSLESLISRHLTGWDGRTAAQRKADSAQATKVRYMAAGVKDKQEYFREVDISTRGYLEDNLVDAMATAELYHILRREAFSRLTENHPYGVRGVRGDDADRLILREQVVNRVMLRRSCRGLAVDMEFLEEYRGRVGEERAAQAAALEAEGITPGNGNHLTAWMNERGLLPKGYKTTKTGKLSAAAGDLEKLGHPMAQTFVAWKQGERVQGYLEKIADLAAITGRIHPEVKVLGAEATGRMSYSTPPLQQFPADARGMIVADPGEALTSIDWTSVEPYIMACISKDRGLADFYEAGGDIYQPIVERAQITRKTAKVVVLAQLYGQGIRSLSAKLEVSEEEARSIREAVLSAMPGVAGFSQVIKNAAASYGLIVTISGRILPIPSDHGRVRDYMAVNYTVQGSAYDVLAETIWTCHERGLSDAIRLAMHDELVVVTEAAHDVRKIMETSPPVLDEWAGRATRLRTDSSDMGLRWASV